MAQGTVSGLRDHRRNQLEHRFTMGHVDLVFPDELGNPTNPMALTKAQKRLARLIDIKNIRIRDLRHFHATLMLQNGQNPVLVTKRVGHLSVSMPLDLYAHTLVGWQKDAANKFAEAIEQT